MKLNTYSALILISGWIALAASPTPARLVSPTKTPTPHGGAQKNQQDEKDENVIRLPAGAHAGAAGIQVGDATQSRSRYKFVRQGYKSPTPTPTVSPTPTQPVSVILGGAPAQNEPPPAASLSQTAQEEEQDGAPPAQAPSGVTILTQPAGKNTQRTVEPSHGVTLLGRNAQPPPPAETEAAEAETAEETAQQQPALNEQDSTVTIGKRQGPLGSQSSDALILGRPAAATTEKATAEATALQQDENAAAEDQEKPKGLRSIGGASTGGQSSTTQTLDPPAGERGRQHQAPLSGVGAKATPIPRASTKIVGDDDPALNVKQDELIDADGGGKAGNSRTERTSPRKNADRAGTVIIGDDEEPSLRGSSRQRDSERKQQRTRTSRGRQVDDYEEDPGDSRRGEWVDDNY